MPSSQIGLHTAPGSGCKQVSPKQLTTLVNSTDCAGENNSGCIITNTSPSSYGAAFAAAQGGVFITEFAETGISVWFFARKDIPKSVNAGAQSIDTASLGTPMGNWPSTGCDIKKAFQPQNLVFTVTLCGDFAGPPNIFTQTCTGICYKDYVIKDPSVYDNAYFDVEYVKVFSSNPSTATSQSSTGTGTSAGSPSTSGQSIPVSSAVKSVTLGLLSLLAPFLLGVTLDM